MPQGILFQLAGPDFHETFSSLCTSLLFFFSFSFFSIPRHISRETELFTLNILLKTHSKHADGSSSGRSRKYYFTVHSLGEGDAHYLSNTALAGMGMFLQFFCQICQLIPPTKTDISNTTTGENGILHKEIEAFFYLKSPITCKNERKRYKKKNEISGSTAPLNK